jgi:hypothetical protein
LFEKCPKKADSGKNIVSDENAGKRGGKASGTRD